MKAMTVRLDDSTYADLEERSTRLGIPPAVLARAFIVGALDGGADLMISPTLPELQRVSTATHKPRVLKKQKKQR